MSTNKGRDDSKLAMDGLRPVTLRVETPPEVVTDHEEVSRRMAALGGQGWVCTTDRVTRYDGGLVKGWVLCAEVATPGESLHVRQHGDGWALYRLVEEAGEEHLAGDQAFLSTERPGRMVYRTYWHKAEVDGIGVWEPFAARFVGWS